MSQRREGMHRGSKDAETPIPPRVRGRGGERATVTLGWNLCKEGP